MTVARPARATQPLSAWNLARTALRDFKGDWKRYLAILALVAVPTDLIGLSGSIAGDATLSAYISVAALIMNVALIWAIVERERSGVVPSPHSAYYDSGIALVRFLIVTALLVLMLVPAALGAAIYLASLAVVDVSGSTFTEQLLIGLACLVLAVPSVWLLTRFGLASMVAIATDLRPVAALRYARRLTVGRFWRIFGRYAALVLFLIVVSVPIALITALLAFLKLGSLATFFFELATTFTALPLANLYIFRLYRSLEPQPTTESKA